MDSSLLFTPHYEYGYEMYRRSLQKWYVIKLNSKGVLQNGSVSNPPTHTFVQFILQLSIWDLAPFISFHFYILLSPLHTQRYEQYDNIMKAGSCVNILENPYINLKISIGISVVTLKYN